MPLSEPPTVVAAHSKIRQGLAIATWSSGAYVLGLLAGGRFADAAATTGSPQARREVVLVGGFALLVLAFAATARRWPSKWLLLCASIAVGLALAQTVALYARLPRANDHEPRDLPLAYAEGEVQAGHGFRGASYEDPALGARCFPGSEAREWNLPDYDVRYRFDGDSNRVVPDLRDRIVFVGCSFTFGAGVADDEHFPAVVSRLLRSKYQVVNRAQSGWGSNHALVVCRQEMERERPPRALIYGAFSAHLERNYLRRSWFQLHGPSNANFPFFEVQNGVLIDGGMKNGSQANAPDDAQTLLREIDTTVAIVREMQRLCDSRGCQFLLVEFSNERQEVQAACQKIVEAGVNFADLTGVSSDFYLHDHHPRAGWHRTVAESLIAREPLLSLAREFAGHGEP